jgi:hypothetical protein
LSRNAVCKHLKAEAGANNSASAICFYEALIKIGYQPKGRIADILSANGRSTLQTLLNESLGTLFALCAQADKMSAIRF